MDSASKGRHNAHALRPQIGEIGASALDELANSMCGPDDMPVEIDELATHFLQEATQTTSSLPPQPEEEASLELQPLEARLGEACFEEQDGRAAQRAFERLWREIISRELESTGL
jgi:hypothetical protein